MLRNKDFSLMHVSLAIGRFSPAGARALFNSWMMSIMIEECRYMGAAFTHIFWPDARDQRRLALIKNRIDEFKSLDYIILKWSKQKQSMKVDQVDI